LLKFSIIKNIKGKEVKAIVHEIVQEIKYFPDLTGSVKAFPFDTEKMEIKSDGFSSFSFENKIFRTFFQNQ